MIDISGDGSNNQGALVTEARDTAIAQGVTINGLPIIGDRPNFGRPPDRELDRWYEENVVGGNRNATRQRVTAAARADGTPQGVVRIATFPGLAFDFVDRRARPLDGCDAVRQAAASADGQQGHRKVTDKQ